MSKTPPIEAIIVGKPKQHGRRRIQLICKDPSLTKQSEKDGCDINRIMARFKATGILPEARAGLYMDVSSLGDYRDAMDRVNRAQEIFMTLPADMRAKYHNDPATFLDEIIKEENREDARQLGLFPREEAATGVQLPPVQGEQVPPMAKA